MKQYLLLLLLGLASCSRTPEKKQQQYLEFGSPTAKHTWIYLCGLLSEVRPSEMVEWHTIDRIGKKLDIKFIAIIPQKRCPQLDNRLCWPQDTLQEFMDTYHYINNLVKDYTIDGWIGFSNGGFFLEKLAQEIEMNKPLIAIGPGAQPNKKGQKNSLYILIGNQDKWHYDHAKEFFKQVKNSPIKATLIEYNAGHIVPEVELQKLLEKLNK